MDSYASGKLGEIRAEQELVKKGYTILARNEKGPGYEIDLIAERGGVLAFVEVKTRRGAAAAYGREAVTPAKQRRICAGAVHYMMKNGLMNRQARFDVMEIHGERALHMEDAFPYQGPAY